MNILAIMAIWNQRNMLPMKNAWLLEQGVKTFVVDNMSTDGSFEMLDALPAVAGKERFDTNNTFHLTKLQDAMMRRLHFLRPSWVVYHGCDLYTMIKGFTLKSAIEHAAANGYNTIEVPNTINIVRTAEDPDYVGRNPARTFFRCKINDQSQLKFITAYSSKLELFGDSIQRPDAKILRLDGVNINLGFIKMPAEREETFQRRKKAWDQGLRRRFGMHYKRVREKGWLYTLEETQDIRDTPFRWAWEQLAQTFDKVVL